jgi:short-subunit dehydrogenase
MKILLTGAFGNVGTSALPELLRQGHTVRCFDLKTPANERAAARFADRIELAWGDLRRPEDVAAAVAGMDVVAHVAFIIPKMSATGVESEARPDWARAINVGGTRNLIEAMQAQPIPPRLIFTSSLHVYGLTQDQPPPRTAADTPRPVEHYAHHKVECEEMIRASGLTWCIFRLAATLPLAIKLDPGMFDVPLANRIEFVHTHDVGAALANAVSSPDVWGKTLLIGGGASCQFAYGDMVGRILDAMGVGRLPERAFNTAPFATDWLETSESQRLLGYQRRLLDDYLRDMTRLLGFRRHLIRAFRPAVRRVLLARSAYYRQDSMLEAGSWKKVALVTGASSGIGGATAKLLAQAGYRIALVARREEQLQALAEEIRAAGGDALVVVADLADEAAAQRVFDRVAAVYGAVDVLVNSAGFGWYGYGSEMPWTTAWQMMQTNMVALAHFTLLALREMKARGRGHIVNIGSIAGSLPNQGIAVYSATKSFVESFTTSLHRELAGSGVHVSVIKPGPVATPFYDRAAAQEGGGRIPGERFAVRPEAVAQRILALLRRPRRVAYVPRWLRFVPWVEPIFGWLIDLLGPLLLRQARATG